MNKLGAKGLRLFESRAAEYIKDKSKVSTLLKLAFQKGMSSDAFKEVWERLQLMINVLRDWVAGEYKEIPKRSLIIVTAALLYFITPVDLIPDIIPISGYFDDVTVLGFVYAQITKDLDQYKAWKEARGLSLESREEEQQKSDLEQRQDQEQEHDVSEIQDRNYE